LEIVPAGFHLLAQKSVCKVSACEMEANLD